ncbi:MAG: hypothetical protein PHY73_00680, partial [Candidatus Omnitrophica bacterium]|nr:hypothetical protein [Candidatus Omnitrophota bacterium]
DVQLIYNQYVESFKKGVCDFIKVEYDEYAHKNVPRKYFSGGLFLGFGQGAASAITMTKSQKAGSSIGKILKNAALVLLISIGLTALALGSPDLNMVEILNITNPDSLNFSDLSNKYGLPEKSLEATKKLSDMGFPIFRGINAYVNNIPTWQIIALSKEPGVVDAILQKDFKVFYQSVNDTLFEGKGPSSAADLFGVCVLYNHLNKNSEDKKLLYSPQFQETLDFLRTEFPDNIKFSSEFAIHVLNFARNFDRNEIEEIIDKFEGSQVGQKIFINDLIILNYCRTNPRFYRLLFNREELENEVLSTIYNDSAVERDPDKRSYEKERLFPEEVSKYPTLFLLRSLLVYEALKNDAEFRDQIAKIYYEDERDKTTEYGGYLLIKEGKVSFSLEAGYSNSDSSFRQRSLWIPVLADFHFHPINEGYAGPSSPDFRMTAYNANRVTQGFVFSAVPGRESRIAINVDTYVRDFSFNSLPADFLYNLNLDLGVAIIPANKDSLPSIPIYKSEELEETREILRKFIKEEIERKRNPPSLSEGEKNIKNEELLDLESYNSYILAKNIEENPDKYLEEIIVYGDEVIRFFKDINRFREILKIAIEQFPDLALKNWACSFFDSDQRSEILLTIIEKSPEFGFQNFGKEFSSLRERKFKQEFVKGLFPLFENNPEIVLKHADNIVKRNLDFFLDKESKFSKKTKKMTKSKQIAVLTFALQRLAGTKAPFDQKHIDEAINLALDLNIGSKNDDANSSSEGGMETGSIIKPMQFGKLNMKILKQGNILGARQGDTFLPSAFYDMQSMVIGSVLRNEDLSVLVEGKGDQLLVEHVNQDKTSSSNILQKSIADLENHPNWKKEYKENLKQFIDLIEKKYIIKAYEKTPDKYLYAVIRILDDWPAYSKIIKNLQATFDNSTVGISFSNNTAGFLSATRGMSRVLQRGQKIYENRYLNTIQDLKNSFPERNLTFKKSFENNPGAFIKGIEALSQRDVTKKSWQTHKEIIRDLLDKVFAGDSAEQALINYFYFFSLLVRRISKNNQEFWQIVSNEGTKKVVNDFLFSPSDFLKNLKLNIKAGLQDSAKTTGGIDPAETASLDMKGGIDFNAENMNVTTKGDEIDFNIPLDMQNITSSSIEGFVPIIINITPVTDFMGLLGLKKDDLKEKKEVRS